MRCSPDRDAGRDSEQSWRQTERQPTALVVVEHLCYALRTVASRDTAPRGSPFSNGPCVLPFHVREVLEVLVTTGTVKKIVADRGFGFITAEDAKEYFFHRGALDPSLDFDRLTGGEKVQFEIEQSPKGPRASRVQAAAQAAV